MGTLLDRINGRSPIGMDSSPFIYYFEKNADWFPVVDDLFAQAGKQPENTLLYTSGITLTEVLVFPLRARNTQLYERYTSFFFKSPFVKVLEISNAVLLSAAVLRATYNIRTADAVQISACMENGCKVFVTNDKQLGRVGGIEVIVLSDCDPSHTNQ